jgi:hypothetical protein
VKEGDARAPGILERCQLVAPGRPEAERHRTVGGAQQRRDRLGRAGHEHDQRAGAALAAEAARSQQQPPSNWSAAYSAAV